MMFEPCTLLTEINRSKFIDALGLSAAIGRNRTAAPHIRHVAQRHHDRTHGASDVP
jgi:hypothetical protein